MRFNIFATIILSLLFVFKMEAQNNIAANSPAFNLEVDIPGRANQKLYLGNYWHNETYAQDSILLDNQGKGRFSSADNLPAGQYFILIKPAFFLDLLIDREQDNIRIYIDEDNFANNTVLGNEDTKLLWQYINESGSKNEQRNAMVQGLQKQDLQSEQMAEVEKRLVEFDEQWRNETNDLISQYKDTWFGIFLKGMTPVQYPYAIPANVNEITENAKFTINHYLDNIDLEDPRFWRTSILCQYIDNYLLELANLVPDSMATIASGLVAKTKNNEFCFKEMLSYLTNQSLRSSVMGHENIWARLAEDYIFDKNHSWISDTQLQSIKDKYELIKENRIGMVGRNLELETIDGKIINTNGIESDYTILYFYDPQCEHCKIETPLMHNEVYAKYKDKGVEIIAINIRDSKEKWTDYISANQLNNWINCADLKYTSQYWMYYDISSIPVTYILDKEKRIVAKNINGENIQKFLDFYITKDQWH